MTENVKSDVEKIKDLFPQHRSFEHFKVAIVILEAFQKNTTTVLKSTKIHKYISEHQVSGTVFNRTAEKLSEIMKRLELGDFKLTGSKNDFSWVIPESLDLEDLIQRLKDVYLAMTGEECIIEMRQSSAEQQADHNVKAYLDVLKTQYKKEMCITRTESTKNKWSKWLLLCAIRSQHTSIVKISNLTQWVSEKRHFEIDQAEATRLLEEMMRDTNIIKVVYSDSVTTSSNEPKRLSTLVDHYNPRQFKDKTLVKTSFTLETLAGWFPNLTFELEDETKSGQYLININSDRTILSEVELKKLIRLVVSTDGKVYTDSPMMTHIFHVLHLEAEKLSAVEQELMRLEK